MKTDYDPTDTPEIRCAKQELREDLLAKDRAWLALGTAERELKAAQSRYDMECAACENSAEILDELLEEARCPSVTTS